MSELLVRTITGIILAAAAVFSVLYFPVWLFKITIALITGIGTWEIFHLLSKRFEGINPLFFGISGFFLSIIFLFLPPFLIFFLIFLISFYTAHRVYSLDTLTASVFGLSYGVFFISSLALLHEQNKYLLLVLFATVWAGDTMAYFVGKTIGKHRLAPRLSPKKTWEGAFGSIIGSVFAGGLAAYLFEIPEAIIPVLIASILMQIGDLFESFLKRQIGEKDSSHLIPGHGGLLDRIDALIFASVVFVIFFQIKNTL
ncbi:phosphatidate cytidylyltransferase [Persephonella sp.]|uniref:phosphatidate cytidylyltransferase n=1 Tax=Persephonella sp. TaxID=2060922 RepID=UPI0025E59BD9|nr:phosphatidate cytidylyltransferase [Persephonella sp.]